MRILSFQAKHFSWQAHSQTIPHADPQSHGEAINAAVFWIQVEASDFLDESRIFKRTLKQIKWVANNKDLRIIVLHSFAHLGGESAPAEEARTLLTKLSERLTTTGYEVKATPFGWFCGWTLDVYGDSMAKIYRCFKARETTSSQSETST